MDCASVVGTLLSYPLSVVQNQLLIPPPAYSNPNIALQLRVSLCLTGFINYGGGVSPNVAAAMVWHGMAWRCMGMGMAGLVWRGRSAGQNGHRGDGTHPNPDRGQSRLPLRLIRSIIIAAYCSCVPSCHRVTS